MEERERKENEKENNIFKVNMQKIFSEIEEFREDNDLSKLRKLLEAISLKVRLLNADTGIRKVLTVGYYGETYRDKYTGELRQLKECILRGNYVKNECEQMIEAAEERIQKERREKEEQ